MRDKCNQYEAYYLFCNDESFNEHLKSCPDCQQEHIKMNKVSSLIQEVKPLYFLNIKKKRLKRAISCAVFLILCFTSVVTYEVYSGRQDAIMTDGSVLYDLGCPVDDYGLLKM